MSKNNPPKVFKRDALGLIESGVDYVYNDDDGKINWRKMIKPEYLVVNKQNFERYNKTVPKSIEGLDDRDLLILLAGIKDLAQIRGFSSVKHFPTSPSNDYVVNSCIIEWIPNYETENRAITFGALGDASPFNTTGFAKSYIGPIAENRAFVRAVRNFLKINIVGNDEIGAGLPPQDQDSQDTSSSLLEKVMSQNNISFEKIKEKLLKEAFEGAESFTKLEDIPKVKQFELIERIKKASSKNK